MDLAFQSMINLGFKDKELDDIKSLVMDTNFYLLMVTVTVCFVHVRQNKQSIARRSFFSKHVLTLAAVIRLFGVQE